jgi:AcrR family transcriptional regulator
MGKGEQTRSAILDEAIDLASRVGLGGLSIGMLAESTEMSKSGLFAHFKSKEQLQMQTLLRARERFVQVVFRPALSAPRGEKRVQALIDSWFVWANQTLSGGCIFVALAAELDDRPGPLREALVRSERDWLDAIAQIAGTAVAEGEFRADTDLEQFAFEFHGISLGHHHASRLMDDPKATDRTCRAFERLVAGVRV